MSCQSFVVYDTHVRPPIERQPINQSINPPLPPQKPGDGVWLSCAAGGVRVHGDAPRHLGVVRVHGALEGEMRDLEVGDLD